MYSILELFDLSHTISASLLQQVDRHPWDALRHLKEFILEVGKSLPVQGYDEISEHVWVSKTATIAPSAYLTGPTIIGPDTEIRHCAFLRGSILVGACCIIGNSTELKNAILFDNVQVPHFNYVGDSILGYKSHLGAGAITSNVKSDQTPVTIHDIHSNDMIETGMQKLGAMLGDFVEIGCNSVLNPGTIIGRNTSVYPLSNVRGTVPGHSILKTNGELIPKR